ncbi:MAG TPA: DUF4157 domain-containing protein [Polyangia bacterium]
MSLWSFVRGGVRRVADAIEEAVDDRGELLRNRGTRAHEVARRAGGAIEEVTTEVRDGVEPTASVMGHFARDQLARVWEGGTNLAEGVVEGTAAVVNDVGEGLYHVGHGIAEAVRGNVAAGLREIGTGAAQATVGSVVDGVLLAGARATTAVQVVAHVEQRERGLSPAEVEQLRPIFGDAVAYEEVRIKEGRAGLFSANDRPFTTGNTIYMKMDPSHPAWGEILVHEMVHVWQYQNGGADYQSKSLAAQFITRDAYQWRAAALAQKPWAQLNPEDQGALIEEFSRQQYFTTGRFVVFDDAGAAIDRTAYADDVMGQLRNRQGVP